MEQVIIALSPTPPYDFDLTASYATYFRGHYGAESFQDGVFQRLLDVGDQRCLARVRSLGTVDSPHLEIELQGPVLDELVVAEARRQAACVLGTDQQVTPFSRMAIDDPALAPLALRLKGLHVPQTISVFEALILAILGQQISSHVARMLRTLLIQTYGLPFHASAVMYHAFPRPEALAAAGVEGLRSIKLSARKAQYIVDSASQVASGEMDLEGLRDRPDEEVIQMLTRIRGVGLWTAQWILIRALGRTDGFPHGDLALRRAMSLLIKDDSVLIPEKALAYSRRWSPFRSYVTAYLFAAIRSGRFAELCQPQEVGR